MRDLSHLSEKKLNYVVDELWVIESSLSGMGALFQIKDTSGSIDVDVSDFHGIGNALKKISKDISILQDILNCGHDSRAITESYFDEEEDEKNDTDQA